MNAPDLPTEPGEYLDGFLVLDDEGDWFVRDYTEVNEQFVRFQLFGKRG